MVHLAPLVVGGWGLCRRGFCRLGQDPPPKLEVEVVKRSDDVRGFKVLPHRWVVERTFGWLMHHRRLVAGAHLAENGGTVAAVGDTASNLYFLESFKLEYIFPRCA
jgi:hypothetical protein